MDDRSRWWPGFCAPTKVEYRGSVPRFGTMSSGDSCASSNSGFWTLPKSLEHRGNRTRDRAACLELCLGCARCNYVAVSSAHRECGWFWKCPPLDELTILAGGLPIFGFVTTTIQPSKAMAVPAPPTSQPTLRKSSAHLPAEMAAEGWKQLSRGLEGRRPECARQSCDFAKCAEYRHWRTRWRTDKCPCACSMCLGCAVQVDRWRSPTGQLVHSLVTNTEPPFTFAYNPMDADMDQMLVDLIAEPALTIAWHVRDATLDYGLTSLGPLG